MATRTTKPRPKRLTVADLAARLDSLTTHLANEDSSAMLESIVDSLGTITGRLDAQAQGLRMVEQKLEPSSLDALVKMSARVVAEGEPKCEHHHFVNFPEDCTAFCNCIHGPAGSCDHANSISVLPERVTLQHEVADDELGIGVAIEDLMDGGNVAATEALVEPSPEVIVDPDYNPMRAVLQEAFGLSDDDVEHAEAVGLYKKALAEDTAAPLSIEQDLLRVVSRCYYLHMAEEIMVNQPGDNRPESVGGGTRSGFVADAQTKEYDALFPLLYQWAHERGWV